VPGAGPVAPRLPRPVGAALGHRWSRGGKAAGWAGDQGGGRAGAGWQLGSGAKDRPDHPRPGPHHRSRPEHRPGHHRPGADPAAGVEQHRPGQDGPCQLDVPEGSAAEQAAALLPRARVVAAFHHAAPRLLADPDRQVETDVLVAGDDPAAKALVLELADQIPGCRGVDAGPLRLARQLEGFTAVIVGINRRHKIHAGLRISRLGDDKRRRLNAELRPASGSPPRNQDRKEGP